MSERLPLNASSAAQNYGAVPAAPSRGVSAKSINQGGGSSSNNPWSKGLRSAAAEDREESVRLAREKFDQHCKVVATKDSFDVALVCVVFLNAFTVYLEIDWQHLCTQEGWLLLNIMFNLIYTSELAYKRFAWGWQGFIAQRYNLFSLAITLLAWLEISLTLMAPPPATRLGQARSHLPADLIQLARLVRVIKLAEMSDSLQRLLVSLVASFKDVVWVVLMTIVVFYTAGCLTTLFIGLREFRGPDGKEVASMEAMRNNFRSIGMSMYTLFELVLFEGLDENVRPFLEDWHRFELILVLVFILMFAGHFYLLNVFTAIVVQHMIEATKTADHYQQAMDAITKKILVNDLYESLYERNNFEDDISHEDLQAWLKEGTTCADILSSLSWSPQFVLATAHARETNWEGKVSLRKMKTQFWEHADSQLTCARFLAFHEPCIDHTERLEKLTAAFSEAVVTWAEKGTLSTPRARTPSY